MDKEHAHRSKLLITEESFVYSISCEIFSTRIPFYPNSTSVMINQSYRLQQRLLWNLPTKTYITCCKFLLFFWNNISVLLFINLFQLSTGIKLIVSLFTLDHLDTLKLLCTIIFRSYHLSYQSKVSNYKSSMSVWNINYEILKLYWRKARVKNSYSVIGLTQFNASATSHYPKLTKSMNSRDLSHDSESGFILNWIIRTSKILKKKSLLKLSRMWCVLRTILHSCYFIER